MQANIKHILAIWSSTHVHKHGLASTDCNEKWIVTAWFWVSFKYTHFSVHMRMSALQSCNLAYSTFLLNSIHSLTFFQPKELLRKVNFGVLKWVQEMILNLYKVKILSIVYFTISLNYSIKWTLKVHIGTQLWSYLYICKNQNGIKPIKLGWYYIVTMIIIVHKDNCFNRC